MSSHNIDRGLRDIVSTIFQLSEQDKAWLVGNLSAEQKQLFAKKLTAIDATRLDNDVVEYGLVASRRMNHRLQSLLLKAIGTQREQLLKELNNESAWVRAYLTGQFPDFAKELQKDSVLKNKWTNFTGLDAVSRGFMTEAALTATNDALIDKLSKLLNSTSNSTAKSFADYMP